MKKKISQWTSKPRKKGWHWARIKGSTEVCHAGFVLKVDRIWHYDTPYNRRQIEFMWNYEFHPVEPPK